MGGPDKLRRRRHETGMLGVSPRPEDRETTSADGKVTGHARIGGRRVAVTSNEFTVKGVSSSMTNMRKIAHVKRVATGRGMPIVFLGESSGARMPDSMGARGMGTLLGNDPAQYVRDRRTPWAFTYIVATICIGGLALWLRYRRSRRLTPAR